MEENLKTPNNENTKEHEKAQRGRPSKFTSECEETILRGIEDGLPYGTACKLAGICYDTFNQWKKSFSDFSEAVEAAEARALQTAVRCINVAAQKDWRAAAWLLERRASWDFGEPPERMI